MKNILAFISLYWKEVNKWLLISCTLFTATLIYLNYAHSLEFKLTSNQTLPWPAFTGHVILFVVSFVIPHCLFSIFDRGAHTRNSAYIVCLLAAPLIFALKMSMDTNMSFSDSTAWQLYWTAVTYWPLRMLIISGILMLAWKCYHPGERFYGLESAGFKLRPYALMLLIMLPLILFASTQPDFQTTYPKLFNILPLPGDAQPAWLYKLLFELSYGTDFFTIELFFRGFLIVGFAKWVGKDAIIPMACFYCTIHFGKPLGECISSYFGGLLLGVVSYHTRSIYGGLMVHLGIAWMMEAGGYLGNLWKW